MTSFTLPVLPPPPTPTEKGDLRQHAPSTERNREALFAVLRSILPAEGTVLEVAAGSGQHACSFAAAFPKLTWLPTDPSVAAVASIDAWAAACRAAGMPLENLRPARGLDTTLTPWIYHQIHVVICVNMIHIAPWAATEGLMRGAADSLRRGGLLLTYGPYRINGEQTSESNAKFEDWLKSKSPLYGVRDRAEVEDAARRVGLEPLDCRAMPANNFCLLFRKP